MDLFWVPTGPPCSDDSSSSSEQSGHLFCLRQPEACDSGPFLPEVTVASFYSHCLGMQLWTFQLSVWEISGL